MAIGKQDYTCELDMSHTWQTARQPRRPRLRMTHVCLEHWQSGGVNSVHRPHALTILPLLPLWSVWCADSSNGHLYQKPFTSPRWQAIVRWSDYPGVGNANHPRTRVIEHLADRMLKAIWCRTSVLHSIGGYHNLCISSPLLHRLWIWISVIPKQAGGRLIFSNRGGLWSRLDRRMTSFRLQKTPILFLARSDNLCLVWIGMFVQIFSQSSSW